MMPASPMVGGGNQPILDIVGSAAFAVSSARKLSSLSTTPFTARRGTISAGSGDTTATYTAEGNTDESALSAFISTFAECRIVNWIDQSGNGNNANETTPVAWGSLPIIYATVGGGFAYKINTRLSSTYDVGQLRRLPLTSNITLGSEYVIFCVQIKSSSGVYGALISSNDNSPTTSNAGLSVWNDGNTYIQDSAGFDTSTNAGTTNQVLVASKLAGDRKLRVNGVDITATNTTATRNGVINNIGRQRSGASTVYTTGLIAEIIIYNRSMTTDEINTVESNLRAYYGV